MEKLFRRIVLLVLCSILWGCEDKIDKYYERPDWLRGNAYEIMQERGNFSLFLDAVDRAGYKTVLNGRELCTVMAPNDEAFQQVSGSAWLFGCGRYPGRFVEIAGDLSYYEAIL